MNEPIQGSESRLFVYGLMSGRAVEEASSDLKAYIKRHETYFKLCVLARAYYLESLEAYTNPRQQAYHNHLLMCQACEEIIAFISDEQPEDDGPGIMTRVIGSLKKLSRRKGKKDE